MEADNQFVCTGCHTYHRTRDTCSICGSPVVPIAEEPAPSRTPTFAATLEPERHGAMLVLGLAASVCSIGLGIVIWVVADNVVALVATASCGVVTIAMLLPWRQRHNPGGADPVLYGGDRAVMHTPKGDVVNPLLTDTAGVTLNPVSLTYANMGWPVPFVAGIFVGLVPLLGLLVPGTAFWARCVAISMGWFGFAMLAVRHLKREIETDDTVGRGVPL